MKCNKDNKAEKAKKNQSTVVTTHLLRNSN